jgi:hypothetical protein
LGANTFRGDPNFGQTFPMAWFPTIHFVTLPLVLVGVVAMLVALPGSDAGDYFRRRRIADEDPRVWSVSRLSRQ